MDQGGTFCTALCHLARVLLFLLALFLCFIWGVLCYSVVMGVTCFVGCLRNMLANRTGGCHDLPLLCDGMSLAGDLAEKGCDSIWKIKDIQCGEEFGSDPERQMVQRPDGSILNGQRQGIVSERSIRAQGHRDHPIHQELPQLYPLPNTPVLYPLPNQSIPLSPPSSYQGLAFSGSVPQTEILPAPPPPSHPPPLQSPQPQSSGNGVSGMLPSQITYPFTIPQSPTSPPSAYDFGGHSHN